MVKKLSFVTPQRNSHSSDENAEEVNENTVIITLKEGTGYSLGGEQYETPANATIILSEIREMIDILNGKRKLSLKNQTPESDLAIKKLASLAKNIDTNDVEAVTRFAEACSGKAFVVHFNVLVHSYYKDEPEEEEKSVTSSSEKKEEEESSAAEENDDLIDKISKKKINDNNNKQENGKKRKQMWSDGEEEEEEAKPKAKSSSSKKSKAEEPKPTTPKGAVLISQEDASKYEESYSALMDKIDTQTELTEKLVKRNEELTKRWRIVQRLTDSIDSKEWIGMFFKSIKEEAVKHDKTAVFKNSENRGVIESAANNLQEYFKKLIEDLD